MAGVHASASYNYISTMTQLSRELFASSEGAVIDQSFALTQGMCYVVATGADNSQEIYDVLGHQRGWEILTRGVAEPLIEFPPFPEFALAMAGDAVELAAAPALAAPAGEVPVVTDPHYNTLLSHEIVGHPVELDRGLKMETAYAGRSWLLRGLDDTQLGKRIASPLVSAFSDPSLPGYGHYAYDHEGTPARRVVHIDRGMFTGFMNSRQTAAVFGGDPERSLEGHRRLAGPARPHVLHRVRGRRPGRRRISSRRSTTATSSSATGRPPSRRAARTSASPPARSTRSTGARSAGSTVTAASWRTAATS